MLKNYVKTAFRNISKNRLYVGINVFGLSVGLAICLMVIGHIGYELSFEDCHRNKDDIYRVNVIYSTGDTLINTSQVMPPLGPAIREEIPEAKEVTVCRLLGNYELSVKDSIFKLNLEGPTAGYLYSGNVFFGDPSFLKVFTFPLIQGNPETALSEPFSILISEKVAESCFRNENPLGRTIALSDSLTCRVTGVLEEIPPNTQLHCEFLISYSTLAETGQDLSNWHTLGPDYVYLLLDKQVDSDIIKSKLSGMINSHFESHIARKYDFEVQPLKDIYFSYYGSTRWGDLGPHGEISMFKETGIIALFVFLLAIANFINLSTAHASDRMKEVGMRKVFGARRTNLIKQFIGESTLLAVISVVISIILYEITKIIISPMMPREMLADFYNNNFIIMCLFLLVILVGVLGGFYPALYLSRFKPITVLQSKTGIKSSKSILRKVLVVFQFTIAILFICCTMIIYKQMNFVTSQELGFDQKDMMIVEFEGDDATDRCQVFKQELSKNKSILSITALENPPGRRLASFYGFYTDIERENQIVARAYFADYNFIDHFGLKLTNGRLFSPDHPEDEKHSILINETTAEILGFENPIGQKLYGGGDMFYEIIGVVENFHGTTMDFYYKKHSVIMYRPDRFSSLAVKLVPENIGQSVAGITKTWDRTFPGEIFTFGFLEDEIKSNYNEMKGQVTLSLVLTLIAIAIACLGILGLVSFTAEKKIHEIGIRKVLGATVPRIVSLLSKEFIILIAIANVISWPLAYIVMDNFLREFPIRAPIGIDTFILTGLVAILFALTTTGIRALSAALANPADSLRHE